VEVKIIKLLPVIVVFVSLSLWVGYSSKKAAIRSRRFEPTAARLERGRYIVEGIAHCFECHSEVDWEKPGGQPHEGRKGSGTEFAKYGFPWLVAPNITPDTETGAGTWTDEQLAHAIREGIGHDGRRLFPVMPYMYFRRMSDEDLASVIVYLRSVEPVHNALPKTSIPEPMKRNLPAPQPIYEPVPLPDFSSPVARGEYLVTLASCSSCHTPRNQDGPNTQLAFAGGATFKGPWGEVNSANITPDASGIGYYDEALFIQTLRSGHVGARQLSPIMPWGYFRNMTDEDLNAIFAYLRTLPPVKHRVDNTEAPTDCRVCKRRHGHGDMNQ
jgi:mono/diheme cytochrome c family protein